MSSETIHQTPAIATEPPARHPVKHPYLVMMGLYLGAFTGMLSETSLNIALPQLSAAFGIEVSLTQWAVVGYMLVIGLVLPFAGLLMKWFSLRKLTIFALSVFAIGSLISGFAPNFAVLLAGRMVQGIGTGLVLPMMLALVVEVFPPMKIGSAMGVTALVIMFAPVVGPTVSGLILGALSWRWIFFMFFAILVAALIFTVKFLVNPYELTRPKIDVLSCVLSVLGFGGLVAGVSMAAEFGWGSALVICLLVVGIACIVLYARRQLALENPVLNLRAFANPGFRVASVLVMVNFGITLSAMYLLPQYLQSGLLLPVAMAGILMLPGGIVNAGVSAVAGKLYDKIGARGPAICGFGLSAIGATMFLFAGTDASIAYVICCHVVMMIGVPLAMSPCQSAGLGALPPQLSTDGSTILNTMQQVWGAVCTAVATSLLQAGQAAYVGEAGAEAFTQGAHWGFVFALVLAVVGLIGAFRLKK